MAASDATGDALVRGAKGWPGARKWRRVAGASATLPRYVAGPALLVAGIGLIFVGTMVLDRSSALPRWALGLMGMVVAFRGLDTVVKARFGSRTQTGLWLAGIWVGLVVVAALLAPVLPIQSPRYLPLSAPSYVRPNLFSGHLLGTDGFGRDYLDRLIWGARVSLVVGVGCTAVGLALGTLFGVLAGYYRGKLEAVIGLLVDSLLAFPPLIFLLALVAVLRPSLKTLFIAFVVLTVPALTRLSRSITFSVVGQEFIVAAQALGARDRRIIFREVFPNVARRLLGYSMVIVATLILAEASLSFLGLGIKAPSPSWGNMIAESQTVLQQDPHSVLVPAAILFLTVIAFNRLGEAGRSRADARQSLIG